MKGTGKSQWGAYRKLHDKKKMWVARLKGYLDGLPPKTRRRIDVYKRQLQHRSSERLPDFGGKARPLQGQVLFVAAQNILSSHEKHLPLQEMCIRDRSVPGTAC